MARALSAFARASSIGSPPYPRVAAAAAAPASAPPPPPPVAPHGLMGEPQLDTRMETEEEVEAYVCGANESAQLGVPASDALLSPLAVQRLLEGVRVSHVALGFCHSLWLSDEGQVYAVGDNASGQCGVHRPEILSAPVRLEALSTKTVAWVTAGFSHSAAVTVDGELLTFGASDYGQCGHGDDSALDVRRPRLVRGQFGSIASAACGGVHTLVVTRQGGLWAFGCGLHGELGLGTFESRSSPTLVTALATTLVLAAAAGERHSLAISMAGEVLAWGCRKHGALGLPSISLAPSDAGLSVPRAVPAMSGKRAVQVCAGSDWSCAMLDNGSVYVWGRGVRVSATSYTSTPSTALGAASGSHIDIGGDQATPPASAGDSISVEAMCARRTLSGEAGAGGFVDATSTSGSATPVRLSLPGPARAIAVGHSHGLALIDEGGWLGEAKGDSKRPLVYAWGVGKHGELGCGSSLERSRPEPLPLPTWAEPRAIGAGGHGSIVLTGAAAEGAYQPPSPYSLSAATAKSMAEASRWAELAEATGAVFSSVALVLACFGGGLGGTTGKNGTDCAPTLAGGADSVGKEGSAPFCSAALEETYVTLMRTYESAPEVLAALRASIPRLLNQASTSA